jgi:hypothetical protein
MGHLGQAHVLSRLKLYALASGRPGAAAGVPVTEFAERHGGEPPECPCLAVPDRAGPRGLADGMCKIRRNPR